MHYVLSLYQQLSQQGDHAVRQESSRTVQYRQLHSKATVKTPQKNKSSAGKAESVETSRSFFMPGRRKEAGETRHDYSKNLSLIIFATTFGSRFELSIFI